MSMKSRRSRKEPPNLRRFKAKIEEFTDKNSDGQDWTTIHTAEHGKVEKSTNVSHASRTKTRKEQRTLKKMRNHAFKQHKQLPTSESLAKEKSDIVKAKRARVKSEKKRSKEKERKNKAKAKAKEKSEPPVKHEDVRKQGLLEANKADDKLIKQLEKQMKLKRRKTKTLPQSFVNDGLDYILDAIDSEKLKSGLDGEHDPSNTGWSLEEDGNLNNSYESNSDNDASGSEEEGGNPDDCEEENYQNSDSESAKSNGSHTSEPDSASMEDLQPNNSDDEVSDMDVDNEKSESDHSEIVDDNPPKEDIYGRVIDKDGNVQKVTGGYVPPGKRLLLASNNQKSRIRNERLGKKLKGLMNRLSEANIQGISGQIEEMFNEQSRAEMSDALTTMLMNSCVCDTVAPDRLLMEHMMLVAVLHHNVGSELGAQLVHELGKNFDELYTHPSGKKIDNLLIMLCHLFNFKVLHSLLLFGILKKLADSFEERDIELILVILKNVGFGLRKDDPTALKEIIVLVQNKAADFCVSTDQSRIKFMLEILLAVKNNNMRKIPNYDPSHLEHLRKVLRNYIRGSILGANLLRITLDDLLKADERGRWWLVGSAWSGRENETSDTSAVSVSVTSGVSSKILEMARKQRMNTDVRKNVFCILMTSEDFVDAFESLLRLGLKNQQEREIIHVIIDICLQEKSHNPFYSLLAQKFCEYDRRFQMTTQFNLWDKFSDLESLSDSQIKNMAAFLTHLIATKSLSLSVFKKIEFAELDKAKVRLLKMVLTSVLKDYPEHITSDIFLRIAPFPKLRTLREGLKLFIQHFILKEKGKSPELSQQIKERYQMAENLLNSAEGSSRL